MPDERVRFIANGPVEAIDRLLTTWLAPGDTVAVGDPAWLSTIEVLRRRGLRARTVRTDAEGLQPDSLQHAVEAGARAVIGTSRMRHSQRYGVSVSRALALGAVLDSHPEVAVIEDERYPGTAPAPFRSSSSRRWAAIRSAEGLLGAGCAFALVSTDATTAARLCEVFYETLRIAHLLQGQIASPDADDPPERMRRLAAELGGLGVQVAGSGHGLNRWERVAGRPEAGETSRSRPPRTLAEVS